MQCIEESGRIAPTIRARTAIIDSPVLVTDHGVSTPWPYPGWEICRLPQLRTDCPATGVFSQPKQGLRFQ